MWLKCQSSLIDWQHHRFELRLLGNAPIWIIRKKLGSVLFISLHFNFKNTGEVYSSICDWCWCWITCTLKYNARSKDLVHWRSNDKPSISVKLFWQNTLLHTRGKNMIRKLGIKWKNLQVGKLFKCERANLKKRHPPIKRKANKIFTSSIKAYLSWNFKTWPNTESEV